MASIECCGVPLSAVTSAGTVKCRGNERQISIIIGPGWAENRVEKGDFSHLIDQSIACYGR